MTIDENIKKLHIRYLRKHVDRIGSSQDTNRLTVLFFALSGLDLLKSLDEITDETKQQIIDWVYLQQLHPADSDDCTAYKNGKFGFRGSPSNGPNSSHDYCNLAMTYCALASLIILGDDLSKVNKTAIIRGLREHQRSDGSFVQALIEEEQDLRTTFCAATICYILRDWSSIDKDKMALFIKKCLNYENGFGQNPGNEAHAGSTFCAIASLHLMNQLEDVLNTYDIGNIVKWCLQRQSTGFQGRPYKDPDTCYSFWVGASLSLLNSFKFINDKRNEDFLCSTQEVTIGGFAKYPDSYPDILHTFFGISALSLRIYNQTSQDSSLQSVYPALNISERAFAHLMKIHQRWNDLH